MRTLTLFVFILSIMLLTLNCLTAQSTSKNISNVSEDNPNLPTGLSFMPNIPLPEGQGSNGSSGDGRYLYVPLFNRDVHVYDLQNINSPSLVSKIEGVVPEGKNLGGTFYYNNLLFVADWDKNLHIYDCSDPSSLIKKSTTVIGGNIASMSFDGNYAHLLIRYVTGLANDKSKFTIIDISDPQNLQIKSELVVDGTGQNHYYSAARKLVYIRGFLSGVTGALTTLDLSNIILPQIKNITNEYFDQMVGFDDYFIVAKRNGNQSTLYTYSTTDASNPTLIKSVDLPPNKIVRGMTDVDGTLLLYTYMQIAPYTNTILTYVYDKVSNEFLSGLTLDDNEGWGAEEFVLFKAPLSRMAALNKFRNINSIMLNSEIYYAVFGYGSPPQRVIAIVRKGILNNPTLTVSGSRNKILKCPNEVVKGIYYNTGTITFTADDISDWSLGGFMLEASGNGNDSLDITSVLIQGAATVITLYRDDDGSANVTFSPPVIVAKGTSQLFDVSYSFAFDPESYGYDTIKVFNWLTQGITATPLENEPGLIQGQARMDSLIFARVQVIRDGFEVGYFAKIDAATRSNSTINGDLVQVCDGNYEEEVTINKSIHLKSKNGKNKTEIMNKEKGIISIRNQIDAVIEGFTLSGDYANRFSSGINAWEAHSLTITDNTFKNLYEGIFRLTRMDELIISNNTFDNINEKSIKIVHSEDQDTPIDEDNFVTIENNNFSNIDPDFYAITYKNGKIKGKLKISSNIGEDFFSCLADFELGNSGVFYLESNVANTQHFASEIEINDFDGEAFIKKNKNLHIQIENLKNYTLSENSLLYLHIEGTRSASKFIIDNNEFGGKGVQLMRIDCNNSTIQNNVFKSPLFIWSWDNSLESEFQIKDNVFDGTYDIPISISDVNHFSISNNEFRNNNSVSVITNVKFFKIFSNTFLNNNSDALFLGYADNGEVKFNISRGNKYSIFIIDNCNSIDVNENRFINNEGYGLLLSESQKISAIANTFINNCSGIKVEEGCSNIVLKHNIITGNTCWNTGINIENSEADITGNTISDNNGNGIFIGNNADANIKLNNISGNYPAGLNNANPDVTIDATDNYWGKTGGPQADDITGNVNVPTWLAKPVQLLVSFADKNKNCAQGRSDSVLVSIQNIIHPDDSVQVNISDENDWITSEKIVSKQFTDSTGYSFYVHYNVPADNNNNNKIIVNAASILDPQVTASDTMTVVAYQPAFTSITVSPDSISVMNTDSLLFTAVCYDQYDNLMDANVQWSASIGSIDQNGLFSPDSTVGIATVTAMYVPMGISHSVKIYLNETEPAVSTIKITPESIVIKTNKSILFTAQPCDPQGFKVSCAIVWSATGGIITEYGLFTAGTIAGTYTVTATDTISNVISSTTVVVGDESTYVDGDNTIPISYSLSQNYPNPFNPKTNIDYSLAAASKVTLKVYDILGREIAVLVNKEQLPGNYKIEFDGNKFASGVYFYRITAGKFTSVRKLVLIK